MIIEVKGRAAEGLRVKGCAVEQVKGSPISLPQSIRIRGRSRMALS